MELGPHLDTLAGTVTIASVDAVKFTRKRMDSTGQVVHEDVTAEFQNASLQWEEDPAFADGRTITMRPAEVADDDTTNQPRGIVTWRADVTLSDGQKLSPWLEVEVIDDGDEFIQ